MPVQFVTLHNSSLFNSPPCKLTAIFSSRLFKLAVQIYTIIPPNYGIYVYQFANLPGSYLLFWLFSTLQYSVTFYHNDMQITEYLVSFAHEMRHLFQIPCSYEMDSLTIIWYAFIGIVA
jgi:hypothetical protein